MVMSLGMVAIWVLAGLLAGFVTQAGGYGRKGHIVLGLVGSLGAGGLLWRLPIWVRARQLIALLTVTGRVYAGGEQPQ
jgi:uncharacterized membrane protein YeaQ/YmgE (transglycosylase-associated protein family)